MPRFSLVSWIVARIVGWTLLVALGLFVAACGVISDEPEELSATSTDVAADTTETLPPTTATSTTTPASTTTEAPTTTVPPNFSDTFERVASGVYMVEAEYCEGFSGTGTAFLIDDDLVLTAFHVTGQADEVRLTRADGTDISAAVVGVDAARDLALLQLPGDAIGHRFSIDDAGMRVGDEVAALGHPINLPLTFTSGRLSAVDYTDPYVSSGIRFHQTDAPLNPGNSGGPLIDVQGRVVGMADWKFSDAEGISFVVAGKEIINFVNGPKSRTIEVELGCEDNTEDVPTDDPVYGELVAMFEDYFFLINDAREGEAYDRHLGPRLQGLMTRNDFIEAQSTSVIEDLNVYHGFPTGPDTAEAWVSFTSRQAPQFGPDGQTCSTWDLTYELLEVDGNWRIQRATNSPGSPSACEGATNG